MWDFVASFVVNFVDEVRDKVRDKEKFCSRMNRPVRRGGDGGHMKQILLIVAGLAAGVILGSWVPKADLRTAREEIASLRRQVAEHTPKGASRLEGLRTILPIPEKGKRAPARAVPKTRLLAPPATPPVASPASAPAAVTSAPPARPHAPVDFKKHLQAASDAWRVRVELARSSFVSNVATNEQAATTFDTLMEAMNIRLADGVQRWVATIKAEESLAPETGIRMMNDLSGILVQGYNDLDRTMPPDWREKAGSSFQLVDFIDPDVALPLAEVEGLAPHRPSTPSEASPDAGTNHVVIRLGVGDHKE